MWATIYTIFTKKILISDLPASPDEQHDVKNDRNMALYKITVLNKKLPEQEFAIYDWMPSPANLEKIVKRLENGFLVKSVERVNAQGEARTHSSTSLSSNKAETEGKLVSLWKIGDDHRLKGLVESISEIGGVLTTAFFDYRGKLVYREVRDKSVTGFETDGIGIGTVALRGLGVLRAAQSNDGEIGKTQFLVIGRESFKAIFIPIPQLRLVARLAVERNVDATSVHDQLAPLVQDYLNSAGQSS
jgi:hypothetical protein